MKNIEEVIKLSEKCLNCKNPSCRQGCAIETSIPQFISKIKEKKFQEAYFILQENNIMSNICGIVCPAECMDKCIRGIKGNPVKIKELENFVNKWAEENNVEYIYNSEENNNIKIAVVGGGPAGISCSVELIKRGFNVTIFEKESEIGGVLRYGIPDFRLSKNVVDSLIDKVKKLGIKIETGSEFGKDITVEYLKEKGYKNIFLALGASKSSTYKLSNNGNNGIYESNDFLKKYNSKAKTKEKLGVVVVIGGGNVAVDIARISKRKNADKVYIVYRGTPDLMSASKIEIEDAIKEGIEIIYSTKIIECIHEGENLKAIICIKTKIEEGKLIDIKDSEFKMKVDNIIFAIGMHPDKELFEKNGFKFDRSLMWVNENQMTNIPGVFAGGDLIESKSSVCRAIKMGKTAALNIEKYIGTCYTR